MKIYIAVLHDRRCDDDIRAFKTLRSADKQIKKWISDFKDLYEWNTESTIGWARHIITFDDGPSIHVEEVKLDELSDA